LQVLRRRVSRGVTTVTEAERARELVRDLGIRRFEHDLLVERIWQLRENLTAYDASYIALAELLSADLVTTDARLAHAPGSDARVVLLN
ncbi:MAG: type II toxin-antitoxin system VapC family toxin, partial [Actinobacteria bacterium]|nr:type II toxin-antitoxin system VapC family toxin [Actinomycetota bacterium]